MIILTEIPWKMWNSFLIQVALCSVFQLMAFALHQFEWMWQKTKLMEILSMEMQYVCYYFKCNAMLNHWNSRIKPLEKRTWPQNNEKDFHAQMVFSFNWTAILASYNVAVPASILSIVFPFSCFDFNLNEQRKNHLKICRSQTKWTAFVRFITGWGCIHVATPCVFHWIAAM